jgi:hypothetical protein
MKNVYFNLPVIFITITNFPSIKFKLHFSNNVQFFIGETQVALTVQARRDMLHSEMCQKNNTSRQRRPAFSGETPCEHRKSQPINRTELRQLYMTITRSQTRPLKNRFRFIAEDSGPPNHVFTFCKTRCT